MENLSGARLVLVNGAFAPMLSRLEGLPDGVRVSGLGNALGDDSGWIKQDWLEPWLGRLANAETRAFFARPESGVFHLKVSIRLASKQCKLLGER